MRVNKELSLSHLIREPGNGGRGRPPALFLFHGYGSNMEDLMELAPELDQRFFFISCQAPQDMAYLGIPGGWAWFQVSFRDDGMVLYEKEQAGQARDLARQFIQEAGREYQLDPRRIFLMGFSQGAVLCHSLLLSSPGLAAGIAALSGRLAEELNPSAAPAGLKGKPVFASHGRQDQVLSIQYGRAVRHFYEKLPVDLEYHEYDMGHEINPACLADLKEWLKKQAAGKLDNT